MISNRIFNLFILFALLTGALAVTPATTSPASALEQPIALPIAAQSATEVTSRISVASDGTQANNESDSPSISADGRYVAFFSKANNLVSSDTNGYPDVFVHDRETGTNNIVSVASDGAQVNDWSGFPSISADGRYVTFQSLASNLVSGDINGTEDVFIHDRETGAIARISVASDGAQANNWSNLPSTSAASISVDGRYVTFFSLASNLVSGDTNGMEDIFVHDLVPAAWRNLEETQRELDLCDR